MDVEQPDVITWSKCVDEFDLGAEKPRGFRVQKEFMATQAQTNVFASFA